jgi:hypothetical protein
MREGQGAEARMMMGEVVRPNRQGILVAALVLAGLLVSAVIGIGIVQAPIVMLAAAMLALVSPLLERPLARLVFVVVGGAAVLGASDTLSTGEIVYVLGSGLVVGMALLRMPSLRGSKAYAEIRFVLYLSLTFGAYVLFRSVLAISIGVSPSDVLRESASLLLFAFIPLLALDAGTGSRPKQIKAIFVVISLSATVSYALIWLSRRGLSTFTTETIGLVGGLPAALFCYVSAGFLLGRRRLLWAVAASGVLALILLGGNRSGLIVLCGVLAIALVGRRGRSLRILRLAVTGSLVAILAVITLGYTARGLGVDTSVLSSRYESVLRPSGLISDQAVDVRLTQTRAAWDVLQEQPILGAGPGYAFIWTDPLTRLPRTSPYIDSPLQFPAKFGAVGVVFWLGLLFAYGSLLIRITRSPNLYRAALLGFGAVMAAWSFVGSPMEDKGGALGLLLLIALSLSIGEQVMETEGSGQDGQRVFREHGAGLPSTSTPT